MTRALSQPHRSSRESRADVARDVRRALRAHGEMTNAELAEALGLGRDLVRSVCKELETNNEIRVRRGDSGGHRPSRWRLPGQSPDSEARVIVQVCREAGLDAEVASWHDQPRVRARDAWGGWAWLDHEHDVRWLMVELDREAAA